MKMKPRLLTILVLGMAMLCAPSLFAQSGSVQGTCKDVEGKPIVGAEVVWLNLDNGSQYKLKTDKKGNYFSLGVAMGKYKVTLLQGGKELFHYNGVVVQSDTTTQDFNLQKEQENAAKGVGLTPEQLKQQQEQQAKQQKEVNTVKTLNEKLAAAAQSTQSGDYDSAIATLTEASQIDPSRDLIWFKLADAYRSSVAKQTDAAEKSKRMDTAITDYQKAIDLKKQTMGSGPAKPEDQRMLAAYYNNLGEACGHAGKTDCAVQAYTNAVQVNPTGAGQYYFNMGAILTNANTANDPNLRKQAVDAFDKAIAADPSRADSYYWKGTNLIGMATLKGDKMVAPDGTAEAFQKYLALAPTGPHAEEAKAMLQGLGSPVETSYGKSKKSKK
jgi:tetratricopeptide (TPR) repeat protein